MKNQESLIPLAALLSIFLCFSPPFVRAQEKAPEDVKRSLPQEKGLDLTEAQKEQLKGLRQKWQNERRAFQDAMQSQAEELRGLMKDPEANAEKIENLRDEMFNLRLEQQKKAYQHRKEVRKVFTPDQLKKMPEFGRKMAFKRGRRGPGFFGHGRFLHRDLHFRGCPFLRHR